MQVSYALQNMLKKIVFIYFYLFIFGADFVCQVTYFLYCPVTWPNLYSFTFIHVLLSEAAYEWGTQQSVYYSASDIHSI